MKIDIASHITPPKFRAALEKKLPPQITEKLPSRFLPTLVDLDTRFRIMDSYEDMTEVLTLTSPPLEQVAEPQVAVELAQVANDEMAELVARYPGRFIGAVACLPMNDLDAALKEADRAINDLNLKGIQLLCHIAGKPLDSPEFMPLYEKMVQYDLPIWIHPAHPGSGSRSGQKSPDDGWRVVTGQDDDAAFAALDFQVTGQTSAAMTRLVYNHVLDRYPKIKFITHHCGSSVPYFANRLEMSYNMFKERRGAGGDFDKPILDYFKMFYADTALHGNVPAMMCGYSFFGAGHLLFGTDMPFDAELGLWSVRKTIEAIEQMPITDVEKRQIFEGNARELLHLPA